MGSASRARQAGSRAVPRFLALKKPHTGPRRPRVSCRLASFDLRTRRDWKTPSTPIGSSEVRQVASSRSARSTTGEVDAGERAAPSCVRSTTRPQPRAPRSSSPTSLPPSSSRLPPTRSLRPKSRLSMWCVDPARPDLCHRETRLHTADRSRSPRDSENERCVEHEVLHARRPLRVRREVTPALEEAHTRCGGVLSHAGDLGHGVLSTGWGARRRANYPPKIGRASDSA